MSTLVEKAEGESGSSFFYHWLDRSQREIAITVPVIGQTFDLSLLYPPFSLQILAFIQTVTLKTIGQEQCHLISAQTACIPSRDKLGRFKIFMLCRKVTSSGPEYNAIRERWAD